MKKIISLTLAAAMAAGLAGCRIETPATVGSIGTVEIPAGVYLFSQLSAYQTAAGLASGASGVKEVLKAQVTPEDAAEGETVSGSEYIAAETLKDLQKYAATEAKFAESGLTLSEEMQASVDSNVEQQWSYYGETYAKNGIGEESLRKYVTYMAEYNELFAAEYDVGGAKAVSDAECAAWLEENAVSGKLLVIPSSNTQDSTKTVTEEQTAKLNALGTAAAEAVNAGGEMDAVAEDTLKQAFDILEMEYAADSLANYYSAQIFMPSTLAYYDDGNGGNSVADPVRATQYGEAVSFMLNGSMQVVIQREKAADVETLDNIKVNYNLLSAMKSDEFEAEMQDAAAVLEQKLDEKAIKTYSVEKIKA